MTAYIKVLVSALKEDLQGQTPLHRACMQAAVTIEIIYSLLNKGQADPQAQDHRNLSPLDVMIDTDPARRKRIEDLLEVREPAFL